jgi:hypothetical protein
MKSFVPILTRALALLGVALFVLDVIGGLRLPGSPWRRWLHPVEIYAVAMLQLVPIAGFRFPHRPDDRWSPSMKWMWALWLLSTVPILLLGAMTALLFVYG